MADVDLPFASFHLLAWWAVCGAVQGRLLLAPRFWRLLLCDSGQVTDFSGPRFAPLKVDGLDLWVLQAEVLFYRKVL